MRNSGYPRLSTVVVSPTCHDSGTERALDLVMFSRVGRRLFDKARPSKSRRASKQKAAHRLEAIPIKHRFESFRIADDPGTTKPRASVPLWGKSLDTEHFALETQIEAIALT